MGGGQSFNFLLWGPWLSFWKWSSDVSDLEQTRFWKSSPIMSWSLDTCVKNLQGQQDRYEWGSCLWSEVSISGVVFNFCRTKLELCFLVMLVSGFSEGYHQDHWPRQRNPPDQRDHQLHPEMGALPMEVVPLANLAHVLSLGHWISNHMMAKPKAELRTFWKSTLPLRVCLIFSALITLMLWWTVASRRRPGMWVWAITNGLITTISSEDF